MLKVKLRFVSIHLDSAQLPYRYAANHSNARARLTVVHIIYAGDPQDSQLLTDVLEDERRVKQKALRDREVKYNDATAMPETVSSTVMHYEPVSCHAFALIMCTKQPEVALVVRRGTGRVKLVCAARSIRTNELTLV